MTTYSPFTLAIAAALGYAGFKRGQAIEKKCPDCKLVLPFLGWSLLGTVGPGYLVGRLSSTSSKGVSEYLLDGRGCRKETRSAKKLLAYCTKQKKTADTVGGKHYWQVCAVGAASAKEYARTKDCAAAGSELRLARDNARRAKQRFAMKGRFPIK